VGLEEMKVAHIAFIFGFLNTPSGKIMEEIVCITTGADNIDNKDPLLRRERYVEYVMALSKLFNYNIPTYGVLSEYNPRLSDNPPFSKFPFRMLKTIDVGALNGYGKSQREFLSIRTLLEGMNALPINDNTFIIKSSGRYLLIDDSFVNCIKDNVLNESVQSVVRLCDRDTQQYTFLYALRYKHFKQFYSQDVAPLRYKNIERAALEFLKERNIFKNTILLSHLGILTHIANSDPFTIF